MGAERRTGRRAAPSGPLCREGREHDDDGRMTMFSPGEVPWSSLLPHYLLAVATAELSQWSSDVVSDPDRVG